MFVQHMLAVLAPGGMVATVMPHGVLFRGGAEKDDPHRASSRTTCSRPSSASAPTCSTAPASPPASWSCGPRAPSRPERQGKVLFINADREYNEGRAQNYLRPEHIEKIVTAYRAFDDIDGFAAVVTPRRAGRERLQLQHPPLRRQRPTARTPRRAGPPARRRAQGRGRGQARPLRRPRAGPAGPVCRARRPITTTSGRS